MAVKMAPESRPDKPRAANSGQNHPWKPPSGPGDGAAFDTRVPTP